ncbi:MAG TPA: type I 3-dehydroquinate dehydratase [Thermoanaerobaculia bacterium]|nr:type I 3-dehydroquinate dehydratase [Thermoanaerobaculia bacterium]
MKLVVTIYERTVDAALDAIRGLDAPYDMVELRVDALGGAVDFQAVRAATEKSIIATNRGGAPVDFEAAYGAGIDFVDVELGHDPGPRRDRVVLSHHDYEAMPDVERLLREMPECAHRKIAVTPRTFAENARLLGAIAPGVTVIGMGERGLYSRIAAPFLGSELQFVAVDDAHVAAPGQLTLDDALAIYGSDPRADKLFAIVGNPATHSRSPMIHNPIFRERGVNAAYTIASFETFAEIAEPFLRREPFAPIGMSVTAPFKEEAFAFAQRHADVAPNARDAEAVNTLAWVKGRIVADNTDVDGFEALVDGTKAALVGAGGTARAARVALMRKGIPFTVYNRTPKDGALPLEALQTFDGDLIVDTLPVEVPMPPIKTIRAAYKQTANDLLRAQAIRQSAIFLEACR